MNGGGAMTGFRSGEAEREELIRLHRELGSIGAVAARTGRHRNTVRRLLRVMAALPTPPAAGPSVLGATTEGSASETSGWERVRDGLSSHDLRVLRAVARSAQLIVCRDEACGQEFATFALETKAGKRLRAYCPACGRGAVVRIVGGTGEGCAGEDDGE